MDVRTEMSGEHTRKLTQFGYQRVGAKVSDPAEPNKASRLRMFPCDSSSTMLSGLL